MCGADYVTAIAAIGDSEKGLKRLKKALIEIDQELEKNGKLSNYIPYRTSICQTVLSPIVQEQTAPWKIS